MNAGKSFLRSAMKNTRVPTKITLDAYAASHRAVREIKEYGELPRRMKEQAEGKEIDARSDVFRSARCCTRWQLASARSTATRSSPLCPRF